MRTPLAILAAFVDRLGRYEAAATIAGFALSPFATAAFPEITSAIAHLREVLGDQTYESLARKGETMTTAEMVAYAYDQIDQARAELNAVSKKTSFERLKDCRGTRWTCPEGTNQYVPGQLRTTRPGLAGARPRLPEVVGHGDGSG
jgi:hypothetical protein